MPSALSVVRKFFPNVTVIRDAEKCAEIEVTAADGKNGERKSHKECAMAVACKRTFDLDGVLISVKTAYLIKGTVAKRYSLPESVSREVVSFDRKGGFAPGSYSLSKVPDSRKLGVKPAGKKHGERAGSHKEFIHHTAGIRVVLGREEAA